MNISSWVGKRITVEEQEMKLIQDPKLIAVKRRTLKKKAHIYIGETVDNDDTCN
ncbi:hypothetical protein [Listeria monocytogenes]|uniref:hypothetical protein n=1 Tax=Listeria monocytogenes TaxID=1639 RepID=UPI00159EBED9|nr:hypothetical protein [Listeria monocytogenes]EHO7685090.1 hypothetical protein [Listeria monocytogenes]EIE5546895.1 hypothetical protein [Listeria monocytogenes]EII2072735.1 hypothetical protein [Listeria monocytogenes]EII2247287.1 hypothetical protein [Listeria monocytogenes]EII2254784.1 hypothetical protein [Listeria monocytogenes]